MVEVWRCEGSAHPFLTAATAGSDRTSAAVPTAAAPRHSEAAKPLRLPAAVGEQSSASCDRGASPCRMGAHLLQRAARETGASATVVEAIIEAAKMKAKATVAFDVMAMEERLTAPLLCRA